ncbi:DUF4013 domain-containing protein [Methanocaldococcus fervens]|uniref:Glycerophosphoryl diester phosphodiesterase membrane domain-containing protein n=1 Tax=Methanocaldococcus fervens (strain DSM 4213 / JCM 15782 / AG86) TaxID=573064 RepID=C7P693_METFA|nr:DUF4013 domain-containing protein [Methanocaldococcus fervens]ACV24075.1 hypothetical protein Mefer_0236 [Methanocaldococcus fervens AG86]
MRKFEDYIIESFKYAFSDIKKGIVGGLLLSISEVFSILFSVFMIATDVSSNIPNFEILTSLLTVMAVGFLISLIIGFIIDGYYVRVMKTTVEGFNNLPEWNNFADLFVKGILYVIGSLILAVVFLIVPIILLFVSILLATQSNSIGLAFLIISFVIFGILLIALIFYLPLAEVNFSVKGFLGFFEFKKIFKLMSVKYVLLVIVVTIIVLIIGLIASAPFMLMEILTNPNVPHHNAVIPPTLLAIQLISAIVSGFIGFFMSLFSKRAIALYYKDNIEEEKEELEN